LHPARGHAPGQDDVALCAVDLDVAGIDDRVLAQLLVDVLEDPLVRAHVAARAATAVAGAALGVVRAFPAVGGRPDRVRLLAGLVPAFAAEAVTARHERIVPGAVAMAWPGLAGVPGTHPLPGRAWRWRGSSRSASKP